MSPMTTDTMIASVHHAQQKEKLPTRSRLNIHQQNLGQPYYCHHQHHFNYYYPPRLLFSLGIVQLLSGVALVFLSLVAFRLDRQRALAWTISLHYLEGILPEVLRIIWLGAWIVTSALLTILVTFKPTSALLQILLLLTSLVTIAITSAFAILISNHVLQNSLRSAIFAFTSKESLPVADSLIPTDNNDDLLNNLSSDGVTGRILSYSRTSGTSPAAYFHIFIICLCLFCTLSFVISIISCCIVSHHICSCRRPFHCKVGSDSSNYLAQYQIYTTNGSSFSSASSSNTWSRKQRIVQWVMQQSQQQQEQHDPDVPVVVHHQPHRHLET